MTEPWVAEIGIRPYRVVAEERPDRGWRVYLRWWEDGNWRKKATGIVVRNASGKIVQAKVDLVTAEMKEVNQRIGNQQDAYPDTAPPLTISQGLALAIDPRRGKYPKDTAHRREVKRELERAVVILKDRPWATLKPSDFRALYRARVETLQAQGKVGRRGAEVTVDRVLAVASWLRDEDHIPVGACRAPKDWKKVLGAEVTTEEPNRPRHTIQEYRRILAAAPHVDPRFGLMAKLGIGLRLGQVARVTRRMVDLRSGQMKVPGKGKKGGALVVLLPEDVALFEAAIAGYLAPLELQFQAGALSDYPLFPAGQLTGGRTDALMAVCRPEQGEGGSVDRTAIRSWWLAAEKLAGVPHVRGRSTYGGKRVSVDEAKKLKVSRDALASLGGWADNQMADRIYADQEAVDAAREAAEARAKIRGAGTVTPYPPRKDAEASEGDTPRRPATARDSEWAREELNLRPHAYQATALKAFPERTESGATTYRAASRFPSSRSAPEDDANIGSYRTHNRTHESSPASSRGGSRTPTTEGS